MDFDYSAFINTLNAAMNVLRTVSDVRKGKDGSESDEACESGDCENISELKTAVPQSAGKWNYIGHLIYNVDDPGKVIPNMTEVPAQVYQAALADLAEVIRPGIPPSPFSGEVAVDGVDYYYETRTTRRNSYPFWQMYILRVYMFIEN